MEERRVGRMLGAQRYFCDDWGGWLALWGRKKKGGERRGRGEEKRVVGWVSPQKGEEKER